MLRESMPCRVDDVTSERVREDVDAGLGAANDVAFAQERQGIRYQLRGVTAGEVPTRLGERDHGRVGKPRPDHGGVADNGFRAGVEIIEPCRQDSLDADRQDIVS